MKKPLKEVIQDNEATIYPKNILIEDEDTQEPPPVNFVRCEVCGKIYTKANKSAHKKTQRHQIYDKMQKKVIGYLLVE